jgi:hypothetical protein
MPVLDDNELDEIQLKFCRARMRSELAEMRGEDPAVFIWGAVGRLARRLLTERQMCFSRRGVEDQLDDGVVADYCQRRHAVSKNYTRDFLNGRISGPVRWGRVAPDLIAFILCAATDSPHAASDPLPKHVRSLLRFFFLNNPDPTDAASAEETAALYDPKESEGEAPHGAWYFSPFLPAHPVSTREVYAEWRVMLDRLREGKISDLRMVRVASADHFRMVMPHADQTYALAPAGEKLLPLVEAGVPQVFLYPKRDLFSPAPRQSVERFREIVEEKLGKTAGSLIYLVEVNPAAKPIRDTRGFLRYPFEYLHRHFHYVWYEWKASDQTCRRLMVSRDHRHGPCAYESDEDEQYLFEEWQRLFAIQRPAARRSSTK